MFLVSRLFKYNPRRLNRFLLADGAVLGFGLALALTIISSIFGLFHNLGAGYDGSSGGQRNGIGLLALLFFSALACTSMALALSAFFDSPQVIISTAGAAL